MTIPMLIFKKNKTVIGLFEQNGARVYYRVSSLVLRLESKHIHMSYIPAVISNKHIEMKLYKIDLKEFNNDSFTIVVRK